MEVIYFIENALYTRNGNSFAIFMREPSHYTDCSDSVLTKRHSGDIRAGVMHTQRSICEWTRPGQISISMEAMRGRGLYQVRGDERPRNG